MCNSNISITKDQERGVLQQIKAMVAELGPKSYIATAFRGVFAIAEENIENDFSGNPVDHAQELGEQYPERKFFVVDTLCASLGQGLLVWHAARRRERGDSIEAVRDWVEENKLHLCHWFTVDDLMFLKRGGRVSAATAMVGTMLSIKPVLHVDDEGHLIKVGTARGRKASLKALVDHMEETAIGPGEQTIFISHGDCEEDAKQVAEDVKARFGVKTVLINHVGPVIGAHSGPGTVALFFLGAHR